VHTWKEDPRFNLSEFPNLREGGGRISKGLRGLCEGREVSVVATLQSVM
jgi:hypothetical protein